jgi:hypothetical protein
VPLPVVTSLGDTKLSVLSLLQGVMLKILTYNC